MKVSCRFRPKIAPTLATLALLPVLVQLGLWQWHKGQAKLALQQRMEALAKAPLLALGAAPVSGQGLNHRRVVLSGRFEADHQILLDNQVQGDQAGFHVLTPLRIEGSQTRVLVNRGWVPLGRSRNELRPVMPPSEPVTVTGTVWWPPATKRSATNEGQVWETLDMGRYGTAVPFPVQPFVVRLESGAPGSYVCDWPRPDERAGVNLGYALQWFGMAGVLVGFYAYSSVARSEA